MVGMLGCGCCNNVGDLCAYGYGDNFPPPSINADYYWSYVNAFSDYVEIFPSQYKTRFVRDGRFWRYEENSMCVEGPPSVFAGKFYECEVKTPSSVLKTQDKNYRTHNFLFETDASVTENAAILGYSYFGSSNWGVPSGYVYTTGCIQRIGNEGGFGAYAHGLLIKQFRSENLERTHSAYGDPTLWYVVFQDVFPSGILPPGDFDGVQKFLEKQISWGSHRLGIGIETPQFGYAFGDNRYKNNFYLDGVIQHTISQDSAVYYDGVKPRFFGTESNWFAYGCVTMTSAFWEPRLLLINEPDFAVPPGGKRIYYRTNPINSRSFDEIAFTKHPKPATRP